MVSDAADIASETPGANDEPSGLPDTLTVLVHGLAKRSANSSDEAANLNRPLLVLKVAELKSIAMHLNVRLTGGFKEV